jgi:hypothetical protein
VREDHATAIARLVLRELEKQPPRVVRRLLVPQLRWLAADPDEEQAREAGVLAMVEHARDEHLARLDADDGFAALVVPWQEVVEEATALADPGEPVRCPRCAARLPRRRQVCSRCRLPTPRPPPC